jgi:hypothetical protein
MDNEISVKQAKNGTYVISYYTQGKKSGDMGKNEIVTAQDLDELAKVIGQHFNDKKSAEEQQEYNKGAAKALSQA